MNIMWCTCILYILHVVSTTCNHGEVRLFGGYSKNDGIAEVCVGGQWADICYSGVMNQTNAARVFCRQLIGQEPCMS